MEESTTTEAPVETTSVEETQPVSQETEAVTTTEESTQTTTEESPSSASEEFNSAEWMQKKGLDPSDPESIEKLAKMAFNSEKLMHQSTEEKANLTKQLNESPVSADTDNELVQQLFGEVTSIKRAQAVEAFKKNTGLTDEQEQQMVSYLGENPQIGELINAGYISLPQLKAMAVGSNEQAIKSQGGKEALQQLANKQRASSLPGNATTSTIKAAEEDAFLSGLMGKS